MKRVGITTGMKKCLKLVASGGIVDQVVTPKRRKGKKKKSSKKSSKQENGLKIQQPSSSLSPTSDSKIKRRQNEDIGTLDKDEKDAAPSSSMMKIPKKKKKKRRNVNQNSSSSNSSIKITSFFSSKSP